MRKVKSKPLTKRTNASLSITNHAAQREKQIEKREREREGEIGKGKKNPRRI